MARPKSKDPKSKFIGLRLTKSEYNKLMGLAKLYTKEGVSDYIRMVLFSYDKVGSKSHGGC